MLQKSVIDAFHLQLRQWYARSGRHHLPWRQTHDPYPIWLSEVMLQQTQVTTVLARYYHPFLAVFPTIEVLAAAERQQVMKAWEGLGYYRRAGFLHDAAKQIVDAGGWSAFDTIDKLMKLPGIGRNTAHAVGCFGFGIPVPVMEANLKRVLARIFAWQMPSDAQLWEATNGLFDPSHSFEYNQAMMDIGATICTPRKPACMLCPANKLCQGQTNPEAYPAAKTKKEKPVRRNKLLLIFQTDDLGKRYFYMFPRETVLLGGLFGFPQIGEKEMEYDFAGQKICLEKTREVGEISHTFTHFRMDCSVWLAKYKGKRMEKQMYTVEEIAYLPIAAIDKKAIELLRST